MVMLDGKLIDVSGILSLTLTDILIFILVPGAVIVIYEIPTFLPVISPFGVMDTMSGLDV